MPFLGRCMAGLLVVCLALPLPVQAGMVGTASAISAEQAARIHGLLEREEVRAALERHGVDAAQARARVAALTEEEAAVLAERLEALPAGGSALGLIVAVFLVLLLTDILGFTKIFPFTRAACDRGRC